MSDIDQSNTVFINFIADINDKTTSLFLYLMTEQLRSGIKSYRINISSKGGMVLNAISIYNFLNGLKDVHIHTHNLGQIDSSANMIFLAGHTRTASKASTFLLHPPQMIIQSQASLPIELLRERLEGLEKDQLKMAEIIGDKIIKNAKEVMEMFNQRRTYSSEESIDIGFINKVEEFVALPGVPIFSITSQS